MTSPVIYHHQHHLLFLHHHLHPRHIATATQTIVEPTLNWTSGELESEPVKRGRGRPRKYPLPDTDIVKRPRGRPRKLSVVDKELVEPESKPEPRGRPPKPLVVEKKVVERERKPESRGRPPKLLVVDKVAVERERKPEPRRRLPKLLVVDKAAAESESKPEPEPEPETETLVVKEKRNPPRNRWAIEQKEPIEQFVEPVLDWVSGHREDFLKAARFREIELKTSGIEPDAIETPRLNWLPTNKEGHDTKPPWQETIRYRLGAEPATLLALREVVKRRRTKPPDPGKELVTRYPLFELPPTPGQEVTRKVISTYQNASEYRSKPNIKIGRARRTAINPRTVPEGRLRIESFSELFETSQWKQGMDKSSESTGANDEPVPVSNPDLKRTHASPLDKQELRPNKKKRGERKKPIASGGHEDVILYDIKALLTTLNITEEDASSATAPEHKSTLELTIIKLTSSGDGLAVRDNRVYCVPFTIPGDIVEVQVRKDHGTHNMASLIKVITPSPDRDDSLINCKYFSSCSGCQYQMLPYENQLEQKRHVVEKAFTNFSNIPAELLPKVLPTMGSPLQYGYRTKLTPHFNGPRKGGFQPGRPPPNIGFVAKFERFTLDIEDCPIGTDILRQGLKDQREWVRNNLDKYRRGATLLLRESTDRVPIEDDGSGKKYVETKSCITNSKQRSVEHFGDFKFNSPAGSFFQNNNSILESVGTNYPPPLSPQQTTTI